MFLVVQPEELLVTFLALRLSENYQNWRRNLSRVSLDTTTGDDLGRNTAALLASREISVRSCHRVAMRE